MMRFSRYNSKSPVMILIAVNVAIFFVQLLTSAFDISFTSFFALHKGDLMFRPYTLLTSMFLHGSLFHLFINMFVLYMFGSLLEQRIGAKRFVYIYFLAGILASVVSSFIYQQAVGASGAIMGVLGVVIVLLPNLMVLFFFVVPMPLWIAGIVIAFIEVFGAFGTGTTANVAHLIGMAVGVAYGFYLKKNSRKFRRKMRRTRHLGQEDIDEYIRVGRI
ncbi:MAG: rhomboid family intramembrane serine protease [Nanobdellota archaeon]